VAHRVPWHWQVPAYLVTKAVGAGMLLIAAVGTALGWLPDLPLFTSAAPAASLLMTLLTTALLVGDLDRPERFWKILARPQWRSWLTRGAVVLMAFVAFTALWWIANASGKDDLAALLAWPASALAVLAAIYTAFLFAQAEGRDLWQSPLLSSHLLIQSVMAGAAGFLLLGPFFEVEESAASFLTILFAVSLVADLLVTAVGEFGQPHASAVASAAARMITKGRYAPHYWSSLGIGIALPLLIVVFGGSSGIALAAAGALALLGLFLYEWAFVFAPQQIPNS
jgi:formate-dependent nitrite reductase membrane component NrfD